MKDKLTALVVEGRITVNDLRTIENAPITVAEQGARITELEAAQQYGHAALTPQIAENIELKRKLANHAARLGTALKTRSELLGKLRERDARIAELEAEAGVDRALLALADARLNREVLKTKGGM